jgi:hypothetical protein
MEVLREGLPVVLGAAMVPLGALLGRLSFARHPRWFAAAGALVAGTIAAAVNGELAKWPEGLFAIAIDSALAGLGAVILLRLLGDRLASRARGDAALGATEAPGP